MDKVLNLLGLAKKAGRLEIGEEPVGSACRWGKARLVVLAADAAENSVRRAKGFAETGGAAWVQIPNTKEELGRAVGRNSCAMLAVTDKGFARAVTEKLEAGRPEP